MNRTDTLISVVVHTLQIQKKLTDRLLSLIKLQELTGEEIQTILSLLVSMHSALLNLMILKIILTCLQKLRSATTENLVSKWICSTLILKTQVRHTGIQTDGQSIQQCRTTCVRWFAVTDIRKLTHLQLCHVHFGNAQDTGDITRRTCSLQNQKKDFSLLNQ